MKKLREIILEIENTNNSVHASIHPDDTTGMTQSTSAYPNAIKESNGYGQKWLDTPKNSKLDKKLTSHYSKFNEVNKTCLRIYTDGSDYINQKLWDKHKKRELINSDSNNHNIHEMDRALSVHKTPHDLTVYSGTQNDPRKMKNKQGIFHHPAYLSTSLDPEIAHDFSHYSNNLSKNTDLHVFKINVPKGHPGAYVDHIGIYKDQHEFIIPRATNLKYLHTTKEIKHDTDFKDNLGMIDPNGEKYTIHTHHMEIS